MEWKKKLYYYTIYIPILLLSFLIFLFIFSYPVSYKIEQISSKDSRGKGYFNFDFLSGKHEPHYSKIDDFRIIKLIVYNPSTYIIKFANLCYDKINKSNKINENDKINKKNKTNKNNK